MTPGAQDLPTARALSLVGCRRCARVWPMGQERCGRCGADLSSRDGRSLSRVWAWWAAGLMAYVPANLWPMLETTTLGRTQNSTIVGGALELARHDALGVALIILLASVLIPTAKFAAIAHLAMRAADGAGTAADRVQRQHLYEVVEYIGRWSMIDVFVVAILVSLVQLDAVATILPGPAALAFAVSVGCTMLSAQALDPRLIWDPARPPAPKADPEGPAR